MPCRQCGNKIVENPDIGLCASCAALERKKESEALKPTKFHLIPKQSPKNLKETRIYTGKRKKHLVAEPACQARLTGCTGTATQIHHTKGRGKNLNNEQSFLSVCDSCHAQLHDKLSADERREKGLLT